MAMLLLEAVASSGAARPVQVFASDVDDRALETWPGPGSYAQSIAEAISAGSVGSDSSLKNDHKYQVSKQLREAVVFSRQDLISDPPFSKTRPGQLP